MQNNHYQHILFDLDRTLWDFEKNNEYTLHQLYEHFDIAARSGKSFNVFYSTYRIVNHALWSLYQDGRIEKEYLKYKRMYLTLKEIDVDDASTSSQMVDLYTDEVPLQTILMPGALEVLQKLSEKSQIHIVTNGFKEVQYRKVKRSGIEPFIKNLFISEEIGFQKPDKRMFDYVLNHIKAAPEHCIMIGDDWSVDIEGARKANINAIYFNPGACKNNTDIMVREVKKLSDILEIIAH